MVFVTLHIWIIIPLLFFKPQEFLVVKNELCHIDILLHIRPCPVIAVESNKTIIKVTSEGNNKNGSWTNNKTINKATSEGNNKNGSWTNNKTADNVNWKTNNGSSIKFMILELDHREVIWSVWEYKEDKILKCMEP